MTKERVAPVQVRLPPNVLEDLRKLASRNGVSLHAEIVGRLETTLANEGEESEIRALKVATSALAERFAWLGTSPEEDHTQLLLNLYRAAVDALLEGLGAVEPLPSVEVRQMGQAAANKLLQEMAAAPFVGASAVLLPKQAALAEAGKALGVGKAKP